ncbi:MAG: DHH family phosphoesterase, partial [Desulfovibrionaceae bacterium]|nr:DHH family phosphoesterase [Desulfovibrionaceae bacterium]
MNELSGLAARLGISPWLLSILHLRGLNGEKELCGFLNPGLRNLIPPLNWPGVEQAAVIIADSLRAGKKVAVWGDYDVDGVTSAALVKTVLAWHGFDVLAFLPHRSRDGYGLNCNGVRSLAEQGVGLILTVDCGISDWEPVKLAAELGVDVVVSDHHLPAAELPPASAVCNPALPGSPYPSLAGVGMAFFLMAQVHNLLEGTHKSGQDIRSILDLVALGTLADLVPL